MCSFLKVELLRIHLEILVGTRGSQVWCLDLLKRPASPDSSAILVPAALLGLKKAVIIFGTDGYGIQLYFGLARTILHPIRTLNLIT